MTTLEQQLLDLLREKHPEYDYEASTNFIADGLLDSFDVVMLTSDLEAQFGVLIPGERIVPENFASIAALAALIRALPAAKPA